MQRQSTSRWARRLAGAALVGAMLTTAACSHDSDDASIEDRQADGPQKAAEALADALTNDTFSEVVLTDDVTKEAKEKVAATRKNLGVAPEVTVAGVDEQGGAATATLSWSWPIEGASEPWTYETPAKLVERDGTWQVAWDSAALAPELEDAERVVLQAKASPRADVLDVDGKPLMTTRAVRNVGLDKSQVSGDEVEKSAREIAKLADIDADQYVSKVNASGDQAFVLALTTRVEGGLDDGTISKIKNVKGGLAQDDEMVLGPSAQFAAPLLGRVAPVTAEQIEKSDGELKAGDVIGHGGIQGALQDQLTGKPGARILAVRNDKGMEQWRGFYEEDGTPGTPAQMTLQPQMQTIAEDVLKDTKPGSAIVAIRPSNGNILVAANGPGNQGRNMATGEKFAPGSTFKLVTTLALLRNGLTPHSEVNCPDSAVVDGRRFGNTPNYDKSKLGKIPLWEAVAQSCNTAFIESRDKAPMDAVAGAAEALGLRKEGPKSPIPLVLGSVPDKGESTEHAANLIGQGVIEASPLGMATVMATLMKGSTVTPRLVLPSPEGEGGGATGGATDPATATGGAEGDDTVWTGAPALADAAQPLTATEAKDLQDTASGVVKAGGANFLEGLAPGPIYAKTGTAQYGTESPPKRHTWLIAGYGDLAICVFVYEGDFGSTTSGPLMENFIKQLEAKGLPGEHGK